MANPGGFKPPNDEGWIGRELADIRREMRELKAANVFGLTGITPKDGGTHFDGYVTINGDGTINGPLSINGPLHLQPGSIENDSLTAPVVMATSGLTQNNFATTPGGNVFAQATIDVPAGYTRASVVCMVVAGAINSTGVIDYLYAASTINGVNGGETPESASASGGYASTAANGIRDLTGLSGGSISLGCFVRTGAAWAANAANFANMNAYAYFSR